MCGGGGGGGGAAAEQRRQEDKRKKNISRGRAQLNQIFGGLEGAGGGTPIWEQQQQAYMDYANPQLQEQFGDAQKQLTFALANQGQLGGSVTGDRWAKLERDHQLQQQAVADQAQGYASQARNNIADQRQSLLSMLNATADPGGTATAARDQVSALSQMPSFSPLGPLFQNATAGLAARQGGMQQREMNERTGGIIYGGDPDRGTGRVIR